jgi:ATP-dependent protease ClpP protease subunit
VVGVAASSATLLAMSATSGLYLYENSTMLIHQLSTGILNGTVQEIEDFNLSAKKLHLQMINFYTKQCPGLKRTDLNYLMTHDLVLNSDDCFRYGLVTSII